MKAVRDRNGDVTNDLEVKGEYILQFGICRGKSFKWALENAMGYVGWLVNSMSRETTTSAAISQNKGAFREYVLSFDEGREAVKMKKSEMDRKTNLATSSASKPAPRPVVSPLPSRTLPSYKASSKFKPTIPPSTRVRPVSSPATMDIPDAELCDIVAQMEKNLGMYMIIIYY